MDVSTPQRATPQSFEQCWRSEYDLNAATPASPGRGQRDSQVGSIWTDCLRGSAVSTHVDTTSDRLCTVPELSLDHLGGVPFGTVLADPPWRFSNRTGKVAPEHKRLSRYDTMDAKSIARLPVRDVMADKSHCYLWVPNALLSDGLMVLEEWGYTYKAMVVWHKIRKDGGSDGRGVGFYVRNVTEPILLGVRGGLRTGPAGRRQVNLFATQKREHSRKPDEQYPLIESLSPGPYLELFARYPQDGWQEWGTEASKDVVPRGRQYRAYGLGRDTEAPGAPQLFT